MKTLAVLTLAFGLAAGFSANAEPKNPESWSCQLQFEAKGRGLQVIVGKFKMTGPGTLSCENAAGETKEIPVKVTMGGKFFQPQVAAGWLSLKGVSKPIGISDAPESLFGTYYLANAQAAVIGGVGASAGFDVERNDNLSFGVSVQVTKGFGVAVGVERFELEAAN